MRAAAQHRAHRRGTTYEWAGQRHASESIKYLHSLGPEPVEVARNLIGYGRKPYNPVTRRSDVSYDDEGYLQVTAHEANIPYVAFTRADSVALIRDPGELAGQEFTVTFEVKSSTGHGNVRLYLGNNQATYYPVTGEMGHEFSHIQPHP